MGVLLATINGLFLKSGGAGFCGWKLYIDYNKKNDTKHRLRLFRVSKVVADHGSEFSGE